MNRKFFIPIVFFSALLGISSEAAWAGLEQPKLTIDNPSYDFGHIDEGTIVEAPFVLRNDGGAPLDIQRVVPACGCTTYYSDSDKKTLKPGEVLTITLRFTTIGYYGPKTKTVRIYTNDPITPDTVITLKGDIQREFTVEPPRAFFGDVMHGESRSADFVVKSRLPTTVLGEVGSRSEFLDVTKEALPDGLKVHVTLKPDAPIGILRSTVTVQTNSPNETVVAFPIFAKIQGDLQFSPTYLSFDLLEGPLESAVSKTVELKNVASDSPKIVSVDSTNPLVSGAVREIQPGKLFEITATIKEGAQGVVRAQLTLTTDRADKDRRSVVLPVYAVISKKGE